MATTRLVSAATFNTTAGAKNTTIAAIPGDFLVAFTAHDGVTTSHVVTDNQGGTWVQAVAALAAASVDSVAIWVRTTRVEKAATFTVTTTPASSTGGGIIVYALSGFLRFGLFAVRSTGKQDNTAAATPAPVLSLTPLSTSVIITGIIDATNPAAQTVRAGYSEDFDLGHNVPATGAASQHRDSGEASATLTYGGAAPSAFGSVAVELDATDPDSKLPRPMMFTIPPRHANKLVPMLVPLVADYTVAPIAPIQIDGVLIDNTAQIFTPTVAFAYAPGLISQTAQVFAPKVAFTYYPGLITQTAQIFTPSVAFTYAPGLLSQLGQVFTPQVDTTMVYAGLISQTGQVFAPSVAFTYYPGLLSQLGQVFIPTVTPSYTPALLSQLGQVFSPSVAFTYYPGLLSQTGQVFTPSVAFRYAPGLLSQTAQIFTPSVSFTYYPGLLSQAGQVFTPTVLSNIVPALLSQLGQVFAPQVAFTYYPGLITQVGQVFAPVVTVSGSVITAPLLSQTAVLYVPTVLIVPPLPPMYDPSIDKRRPLHRVTLGNPRRAVKRKGVR